MQISRGKLRLVAVKELLLVFVFGTSGCKKITTSPTSNSTKKLWGIEDQLKVSSIEQRISINERSLPIFIIESKKHCVKIKATWMKTKQYTSTLHTIAQSRSRSMIPVTVGVDASFFQKIRKNWSLRSARVNDNLSRTSTLQNQTIIFW